MDPKTRHLVSLTMMKIEEQYGPWLIDKNLLDSFKNRIEFYKEMHKGMGEKPLEDRYAQEIVLSRLWAMVKNPYGVEVNDEK